MVQIYDSLAMIYDEWANADRAAVGTIEYYTALCEAHEGPPIVELGVGTGRIAVSIARKWRQAVLGIDCSPEMLQRCAARTLASGVGHLVDTRLSDIRHLKLDRPASLIIMPFRTFGHFITEDDRVNVLRTVFSQLSPGGQFVLDHYIIDKEWAKAHDRMPRLMCQVSTEGGGCVYVFDTYQYDFVSSVMRCTVTLEKIDGAGRMEYRRHHSFDFSWISPDAMRGLLVRAGFRIVDVFGGFDGERLDDESKDQIWHVRRDSKDTRLEFARKQKPHRDGN